MNTAAASSESAALGLHDALMASGVAAGRLRLVSRMSKSNPTLLNAVREHVFTLRRLAELEPLPYVPFVDGLEDYEERHARFVAGVSELLKTVKGFKEHLSREFLSEVRAALSRVATAEARALTNEYERAREDALARVLDIESLLVLAGAGADEDAEAGFRILPSMPETEPGPSVEFEL